MLKRLQSPVVLGVIVAGAGTALKAIQSIPNPTWIDISLILLAYVGAVLGALNNPTDKEGF